MQLVKVKQEFYDLCDKNNIKEELMFNEAGRPCVLILQLKYKLLIKSILDKNEKILLTHVSHTC